MTSVPITLGSPQLRVRLDPRWGGRVEELTDLRSGDDWIYHLARSHPVDSPSSTYDDVWGGGFEELFPNDAPGVFQGRALRDHGELWDAPFEVLERTPASISLRRVCETVPASVDKLVSLASDRPELRLRYTLRNLGSGTLPYLFKLHPAIRVEEGDALLLSGGTVTAVDPAFSRMIGGPGPFRWPLAVGVTGAPVDLSVVPPREARLAEFVYVSDMPEGWCGVRRGNGGGEIRFSFPADVFPYCWLFLAYGGWRNHFTAVLEPCTNMPKDLDAAWERGTCAVLAPGATSEFEVSVSVEPGRD